MKVAVAGAGYVGLVTAACLSKLGNRVDVADVDEQRVRSINEGKAPIFEPGLADLLSSRQLEATTNLAEAVRDSEIVFICVGAATNHADRSVDLSHISQVSLALAGVVCGGQTIVVKSTVPPGTTQDVILPGLRNLGKKVGKDFEICVNPEFLREGTAVRDFLRPDRIVIGERTPGAGQALARLYKELECPVVRVDLKTAEMIKYASNVFLAARVSLVNELGNICKAIGVDMNQVAAGISHDERIGRKYLNAGAGYGGSCLPKDLKALTGVARKHGYEPRLLESVHALNEEQPLRLIALLRKHVPSLAGSKIGVLGLAFKPDTDDVREAVSQKVVAELLKAGVSVIAYDPQAMDNFRKLFPQVVYAGPETVLQSDAIVILTEWKEFNTYDYRGKVVVDGRMVARAREARIYEGICW